MRFACFLFTKALTASVLVLAMLAVPMAVERAQAASRASPSFDCRRAITDGEKAICADAGLAAIDRAIARRYHTLVKRLEKDPAYDLTRDQANFISERDHAVNDPTMTPQKRIERLRYMMQRRLNFLNAVSTIDPKRADGIWINGQGGTFVLEQQQAGMHFHATRIDPFDPAMRCEADGVLKNIMPGGWDGNATAAPGWTIMVNLNGPTISVQEQPSARHQAMPDRAYCTPDTDLTGRYFRAAVQHPG